jgi:hypothetical protein
MKEARIQSKKVIIAMLMNVSAVIRKGTFDIKYTDDGKVMISNFCWINIRKYPSILPKTIPTMPNIAP